MSLFSSEPLSKNFKILIILTIIASNYYNTNKKSRNALKTLVLPSDIKLFTQMWEQCNPHDYYHNPIPEAQARMWFNSKFKVDKLVTVISLHSGWLFRGGKKGVIINLILS